MRIRLATLEDIPSLASLIQRVVPLMLATGNLQFEPSLPARYDDAFHGVPLGVVNKVFFRLG